MRRPLRTLVLLLVLPVLLAACAGEAPEASGSHEGHDHVTTAATDDQKQLYTCGMHPQIVQEEPGFCPICGMELTPMKGTGSAEGVVEIDPVTIQNIGVRTATVAVERLARRVRTTGHFEADEQSRTAVSPRIGGWVEQLHVDYEGARVAKGQPLLAIYSPELVTTQEEYLLALRNRQRLDGTPAAADAQRLVDAARRRLAYWDVSEAQIERLEQTGRPQKAVTLYAPASGTVSAKQVVEGQQVMAGQTLMELANLSRLWLMVDVYEQDLAWVDVGTEAVVELPYAPGRQVVGRVDYVYDTLDPVARTARARVTVPNPDLALKPGMYATVTLVGGQAEPQPVIPEEALIQTGERALVVLALGEGRFRPIEVVPGLQADGRVQVLSGLSGGEEIVTSAQFLIDSEARLKSAVNAMMSGHTHRTPATTSGATSAADARVENGVQVVEISVTAAGYSPAAFTLRPGTPARLVFTRTADGSCTDTIQIPDFGIAATSLPLHEPVAFDINPTDGGAFTFACGMDMVKGTIVVRS